jgi:hypothetical protein
MSLLVCSEHGGQKEASCTQWLVLLWCWAISKLWEMFHYHLPFIKIVSVVSLSYNPQPLCFICIMIFVILVLDAIKSLLHAHFHTSSKERPIFVSHKHYVFSLWNNGSKLILQDKCNFLLPIGNCESTSIVHKWIHLWTKSCTMIISQSLVYTSSIIW